MIRLVLFISLLVGISVIFSMGQYSGLKNTTKRYDFKQASSKHHAKVALLNKLAHKNDGDDSDTADALVVKAGPLVVLDTPQLVNGNKLFAKCVVCHGKEGQGKKGQKAPAIGGQHAWYLEASLIAMKSGKRVNKVMNPYIKKLEQQDFKDLAAYISKLPWFKAK